jgi:fluoride exporter
VIGEAEGVGMARKMARRLERRHLALDAPREVFVRMFWAVAVGAAAGGVSRYYLSLAVYSRTGAAFPWGTLLVNVTGSLLLGFLMRYALATPSLSTEMRLLLTTGFCGGYTTFSTFSYETAMLLEDGLYERAAMYALGSVIVALLATVCGFILARELIAFRVRV